METFQLKHKEVKNELKEFPINVICDSISSAENVGMAFRICEAMGVKHIYLCGQTICPPNKKLLRVSRSAEKNLSFSYHEDVKVLLDELRKSGSEIVALEITNTSKAIHEVNFKDFSEISLVIGNEKNGISPEVLNKSDLSVEIQMYGKNSSVNVINALSISLYELTKQLIG